MFKKFLELMARKFFKKAATKAELDAKSRVIAKKNQVKKSDKGPVSAKRKRRQNRKQSLRDMSKGEREDYDSEIGNFRRVKKHYDDKRQKEMKEFVQGNLDRYKRQRKSVEKYRADVDKGAGKWSPSRGIAPWKKTASGKHLLNTPAASLVGAGTAASLTRKKKRKK